MENKDIRIALLVGGTAPEREVSKESSKSILGALKTLGYQVKVINPAYGVNQPQNEEDFFTEKDFTEISNKNYVEAVNSSLFDDVDLAFIGLHGKWGEDGTIQSLLELKGIKYTGAKVLPSALAMDKVMTKIMFKHFGVPTPIWIAIKRDKIDYAQIKKEINDAFGYPVVIKPADEGSTFGLTVCRNEDEIEKAVELAGKFSRKILAEEYIPGRELTVGVLDKQVLPVLEIVPKNGLYDYECKYTDGMSEYIVPADIPKDIAEFIQAQALKAYNAVECSNYGRVDFRLTDENKAYCLEVNTLPGMTSHSLIPKMAKAVGIGFNELVDRIIKFELNA